MSARRDSGSFLREATFGFVVSVIAAVLTTSLAFVLPTAVVVHALIAALGLTLVLRSLAQSRERIGRIVTLALWSVAAVLVWFSGLGIAATVAIHLLLAWLVRALFTRSRLLEAGLDFGLALLAASCATYAALRTGSVFLACWSFFLVQALGAGVPALAAAWTRPRAPSLPADDPNAGFALAAKAADEALTRIAARRV